MFKTYTVGRSSSEDIVINHDTISRRHLEITITDNGRFFCLDCNSTAGTYVWRKDTWQPVTQGYIEAHEQIALGKKKMNFTDIISKLQTGPGPSEAPEDTNFEPLSIKPRRNSATGEIEK